MMNIVDCSRHIPGDLIMEILLHLPSISLHRFRRVCKQWYSLISNPDFLQTHAITDHDQQLLVSISKLRPFNEPVDFVHVPYNDQYYEDEVHRKPDPLFVLLELFPTNLLRNYRLIDSSNGLLLICHQSRHSITYYVTNPLTKYYFKLPTMIPIPNIKPADENLLLNLISPRHATLVFDPSISLSYKVVRHFIHGHDSDTTHLQVYLYSSEIRSWRVLSFTERIPDPMGTDWFGLRSVLLNSVLYWSYWMTTGDDLVCFDVEKERLWLLPLPPRPEKCYYLVRNCLYFGECGGRLRLIEKYLESQEKENCLPCSFDVMETEPQQQQQYYNGSTTPSWTVKYRVNIGRICDSNPFVIHCYKTKNNPFLIHCDKAKNRRRGSQEEVLLLKLNNTRIASFSLTSNEFINHELITIPLSICICDFVDFFAYKPTLFPVS